MEYLLELYLSRADAAELDTELSRAQAAAAALSNDSRPLRLLRSIYVPEHETCFLLYEAQSADAVREAARRAELPWHHVVGVMEILDLG